MEGSKKEKCFRYACQDKYLKKNRWRASLPSQLTALWWRFHEFAWLLPVALTGKHPRLVSRRTKHRPPLAGTPERRRWLGRANVSTPLVHRAPVEHILSLALLLNGGTSLWRGNRSIYKSWSRKRTGSIEHIGKQWSEPLSAPERENADEENRLVTSISKRSHLSRKYSSPHVYLTRKQLKSHQTPNVCERV